MLQQIFKQLSHIFFVWTSLLSICSFIYFNFDKQQCLTLSPKKKTSSTNCEKEWIIVVNKSTNNCERQNDLRCNAKKKIFSFFCRLNSFLLYVYKEIEIPYINK